MSTAELFLTDEEIADFIRETTTEPQYFYGYEGRELGICPFVTFYVYHHEEDFLPLADKMIALHRELETMIDSPYAKIWRDSTQAWHKAGSKHLPTDLHAEALRAQKKNEGFWIRATDMDSPSASACWAIEAQVTHNSSMRYTFLKITFRHSWYLDNKARWHAFVLKCLNTLQPDQAYSGFEVGNTASGFFGGYESGTLERTCADYFYGMDIDHPAKMGFQRIRDPDGWVDASDLSSGLRTPTWCFLLSPRWLDKLGVTEAEARAALNDPAIEITRITDPANPEAPASLWVRLGELDLYPVEDGVPPLPALASKLIRPVRCDELSLNSLDTWEDDPNPRFDFESSPQWMARFDDDSDWPPGKRVKNPAPAPMPATGAPPPRAARPGEPCPQAGEWFAVHLGGKTVRLNAGDPMPGPAFGPSGEVIWYLKQEK